ANMNAVARRRLLKDLFSTGKNGIGISYLRLSIGASDLSASTFTYNDMPPGQTDPALKHFDLRAGDKEVIPAVKQILKINPDVKFMGSPWTAPPWMKTNDSFIAGELKPECYPDYARYIVKYIEGMKKEGIPIHSLTPQNEPHNPKNEPSMLMNAAQQAEFIGKHLGPALQAAKLPTEIFSWDHNCDAPEYPLAILDDPVARPYVGGTAWHLYYGDISALSRVHDAYPDKKTYFTEQWVSASDKFAGTLKWHAGNVLIGSIRNWSQVVLEWNLAADSASKPYTPGGCTSCKGGVTIDGDAYSRNVGYYLIGHAAKFVPPGSVRIGSDLPAGLPNVAFKTPDDRIVLIVLNNGDTSRRFNVEQSGTKIPKTALELPSGALATCTWTPKPSRLQEFNKSPIALMTMK
ncbi:MAG: glycoside hydrolase family 30 beta sandwich domain-containing protein, partial [Alphaproteobacteria bacterium]